VHSMDRSLPAPRVETLHQLRRRVARWLVRKAFGRGRVAASTGLLPASGIHRILVCHVSHTLGNTLLLTPLLREIEEIYPGAEVDVVTRSPVAGQIFGAFPCVRRIHILPHHGAAAPWRLAGVVRSLRGARYDLAIDPCVRSQSDRIGVLAANAVHKLGYIAAGKSGDLSHGVAVPNSLRHVGQLPVYLLRSATGRSVQTPYPPLDLCLTPNERASGSESLARLIADRCGSAPRLLGVFAHATGTKHLGAEWWQRFARRLAQRAPDARIVEIVPASGVALLGGDYPTFYSSDVRRLACALSGLSLFVSADCGVMHLACAAGVPTAGLFTVTDAREWGPYGTHDVALEIGTRTSEQMADLLPLPATRALDGARAER
jgi:ADP-heptose:LPS heptosyltransferase